MSGLVLVFDLDDTLYPERQFALSGFAAAGALGRGQLGIAGPGGRHDAPARRGHLGQLFRIALAASCPDTRPSTSPV